MYTVHVVTHSCVHVHVQLYMCVKIMLIHQQLYSTFTHALIIPQSSRVPYKVRMAASYHLQLDCTFDVTLLLSCTDAKLDITHL